MCYVCLSILLGARGKVRGNGVMTTIISMPGELAVSILSAVVMLFLVWIYYLKKRILLLEMRLESLKEKAA